MMVRLVYVSTFGWRRVDSEREGIAYSFNVKRGMSLADVGGELGVSPEEADRLVRAARSNDTIEVSDEAAEVILRCSR